MSTKSTVVGDRPLIPNPNRQMGQTRVAATVCPFPKVFQHLWVSSGMPKRFNTRKNRIGKRVPTNPKRPNGITKGLERRHMPLIWGFTPVTGDCHRDRHDKILTRNGQFGWARTQRNKQMESGCARCVESHTSVPHPDNCHFAGWNHKRSAHKATDNCNASRCKPWDHPRSQYFKSLHRHWERTILPTAEGWCTMPSPLPQKQQGHLRLSRHKRPRRG